MITVYGIRNCQTMKKALNWLDEKGVEYAFHDYKKSGVDEARLRAWVKHADWETLLNTRGTTWRKLTPEQRAGMTQGKALALMAQYPSLIKRPVVETGRQVLVGFEPRMFASLVAP